MYLSKLRARSPKKLNYKGTHQQLDNFVHNVAGAEVTVAELGLLNVHPPSTPPIDDNNVGVESALILV
jgi:hypothetical protein